MIKWGSKISEVMLYELTFWDEGPSGNFLYSRQTLNNWLEFIWSKIWKAMEEISWHNSSFPSAFCDLFFFQMRKLNFLISLVYSRKLKNL